MYPKSAADIFEALPKKSVDFVFDEIKGTNKEAKRKLLKAKNESKVETKSFDDADIDLLTFDWVSIYMDRNWWWQVQALPFLGWFAQSYKLFDPPEQLEMLTYCLEATEQWIRQEDKADQSPLRWHDHATAYRLTNFVHCLVAVSTNNQLIQVIFDREKHVPFDELITEHVKWLMKDENYSKHTNHGFDQATAVLSLGLLVEKSFWTEVVEIAESRLVDEVRFAFTEEGVHKENSPGYHVFMMRRLEKLVRLERLGETTVGTEARKIRKGAERFLEAITLPDGTLPMVGDTRGRQKGKLTDIPDGPPVVYDFSRSGYVVIKGKYEEEPYYLLIKNCHDSNYHRHDDDLSIILWYKSQALLGDGGLGAHNEKDGRRVMLRSYACHNVPFLKGACAIRNNARLSSLPSCRIFPNRVHCESWMHGASIRREVDFSGLDQGVIRIVDYSKKPHSVNFFTELSIVVGNNYTRIVDENGKELCSISFRDGASSELKMEKLEAVSSTSYGRYCSADRLEVQSVSGTLESIIELGSLSED